MGAATVSGERVLSGAEMGRNWAQDAAGGTSLEVASIAVSTRMILSLTVSDRMLPS
jgi:hypothetical protein